MTPLEPGGREAAHYWAALSGLLPVAIIGGFVAVITNLRKIHQLPGWQRMLAEMVITAMVGGVAAMVAVSILPLFWPDTSPNVDIAVAALAGSYGQKSFDIITNKIMGKSSGNEFKD